MVDTDEQYQYFDKNEVKRYNWQTGNKYILAKEKKLLSVISKNKNKKILEVGCGEAANLKNLENTKNRFFGVDYSKEKIKFACSKTKASFKVGNALNLPYKDGFFDITFCRDILHHIDNKKKVIGEMKRVTKKKGKIIVIEANGKNPIMWFFGTFVRIESDVRNSKTGNIGRLFEVNKLKIKKIRYEEPFPFYRFLLHYRYGVSFLGNIVLFIKIFDFFEWAFSKIIPKEFWGYVIYVVEK